MSTIDLLSLVVMADGAETYTDEAEYLQQALEKIQQRLEVLKEVL
jgi:hypothetical protein